MSDKSSKENFDDNKVLTTFDVLKYYISKIFKKNEEKNNLLNKDKK